MPQPALVASISCVEHHSSLGRAELLADEHADDEFGLLAQPPEAQAAGELAVLVAQQVNRQVRARAAIKDTQRSVGKF